MTDKEMLEEIKRSINKQWREIQPDVLDVVYLDITEIAWLLEQAERAEKNAQDLEDMDKQLASEQRHIQELEEENKRYKQVLGKIGNWNKLTADGMTVQQNI